VATTFDSQRIVDLGWRQGAILAETLSRTAVAHAGSVATPTNDSDCLILTSHVCDITNGSLEKEPVVEILHGRQALDERSNSQLIGGRNPRRLQLDVPWEDSQLVISCAVQERWSVPRETIETAVEDFWRDVHPAVECEEVDVLGTDEITLSAIERHQRFDADWVSFADETPATSLVTDLSR
jgi:hypothetical protein